MKVSVFKILLHDLPRPFPQAFLRWTSGAFPWIGHGLQITLSLAMTIIILIPQIQGSFIPFLGQIPTLLNYGLLWMIVYPFAQILLGFLACPSLSFDHKTVISVFIGPLIQFFIVMGIGVWCQSWSLVDVIHHQKTLIFAIQFAPLLMIDIIRHIITPTVLYTHHPYWNCTHHILTNGVFLVGMNVLFLGGTGMGTFLLGGIALKMILMYSILQWSAHAGVKMSSEQTTHALLKYLLPLSFSFFMVLFLAQMVMAWQPL